MNWRKALSYLLPVKEKQLVTGQNQWLEITWENGRKVLNSKHANYSEGMLKKAFDKTFTHFHEEIRNKNKVLILGAGAGSIIRLLKEKYNPQAMITAIEFDKDIIDIAKKDFNIQPDKNLEVIHDDAITWIKQNRNTFDLIIDDLYLDLTIVPESLDESFISAIPDNLSDDGLYFKNCIFDENSNEQAYLNLLAHYFSEVNFTSYHDLNKMILCRK
jgi:spermidine synthase